jgi:hypothetical protein
MRGGRLGLPLVVPGALSGNPPGRWPGSRADSVALRRPRGRLKANLGWDQIAKTSSSNATASRRLVGSSTNSS